MASTVTIDGAWTLQNLDTAAVGRLHDGAFLQSLTTTPNTRYRAGVIPTVATQGNAFALDYFVQQNSPTGMSVLVNPGNAVVANASRGPYVTSNASVRTLTVATSDPTNPRIDLVYIQVIDNPPDTGTTVPQVGIVTGTPAASPAVPALPTNGVCIALAQVRVNAGVSSVTNSNITDVRTSAGVGRGPRLMLPGDSLSDPGYCYGELRQRRHAGYQVGGSDAILTDYWGFDSAWHGERTLKPPSYAWQNGTSDITITTSKTGLIAVSIPDPGYAYYLAASAQINWTNYGTGAYGGPWCAAYVALDSVTGSVVNATVGYAPAPSGTTQAYTTLVRKTYGSAASGPTALTGAHTLYLVGLGSVAVSALYSGFNSAPPGTWIDVDIIPA